MHHALGDPKRIREAYPPLECDQAAQQGPGALSQALRRLSQADGGQEAPLVVIVDELDRCRPDYAIKVLEEIKHFFDVPGVVFVLAMHKEQLSKSVRAVYGPDFESDEYLRRFFDLSINLPLRDYTALISQQVDELGIDCNLFRWPPDNNSPKNDPTRWASYVALIFQSLEVTARDAKAIMRFIALFADLWDHPSKIELTCLVPLIWARLKGKSSANSSDFAEVSLSAFSGWLGGVNTKVRLANLHKDLLNAANESLINLRKGPRITTQAPDYLRLVFDSEFKALEDARTGDEPWTVPPSSILEYQRRIRFLDKLLDS